MTDNEEEGLTNTRERDVRILLDLLSHDINNHVYSSMGYLELIESLVEDDEKLRRYLSFSMSELKSISHLVDNVKLLMDLKDDPFTGEPVDLHESVMSAAEAARYQMDDKELKLTLGFSTSECNLRADRFLNHLLTQLLLNSMKYSRNGIAHVKIDAKREGDRFMIIYEDDGTGIPDNLKDGVFTRFERSIREGDVHGKGMGLSVVYNVSKRYGGDITIEDVTENGEVIGTRFGFILPAWTGNSGDAGDCSGNGKPHP